MPKKKLVPEDEFKPDAGFVPDAPGFEPDPVPWPGGKRYNLTPFGTNIPDLPQSDYDPRHIIGTSRGGEFSKEMGRQIYGAGKEIVKDPTTYLALAARKAVGPVIGGAVGGGGEAIKELIQHFRRSPEAPQSSGEATGRIGVATAIGAGVGGLAKGAIALRARAAEKVKKKAAEAAEKVVQETLEKYRTGRVPDIKEKIEALQRQSDVQKLGGAEYKRRVTSDATAAKDKIISARDIAREAVKDKEKVIQASSAEALSPKAERIPLESFKGGARIGSEAHRETLRKLSKASFEEFEKAPISQEPVIRAGSLSNTAAELQEGLLTPSKTLQKVIDLDPEKKISAAQAQGILSDLKDAARATIGMGRTKAQGAAAKAVKEFHPLIDKALEGDSVALAHLQKGRASTKLLHELFERGGVEGPGSSVGRKVANSIRAGDAPESFAKKSLEHTQNYLAQSGVDPKKLAQRSLDSIVEAATPNGVFNKAKLEAEWLKYPQKVKEMLFSKNQIDTVDDMIKMDSKVLLERIRKDAAGELLKVNRQGKRMTDQAAAQAGERALELKNIIRERTKEIARHKEGSKAYKDALASAEKAKNELAQFGRKRRATILGVGGAAAAGLGAYSAYSKRSLAYPAYRTVRALIP
jgi:hypothetical protein